MRIFTAVAMVAFGLGVSGCSGNGYSSGSSANPVSPSPTGNVVTIDVVGINGALSFSPNPATIPAGQMVAWHNVDNTTHRVVLNDRSVDTGNLNPGAFSSAQAIGTVGAYHCSIHPAMVGSLTR